MGKRKVRTQGMNWIRKEKRLAIYMRDGLACAYCGSSLEDGFQLSLDHLTPYSEGGSNKESNFVTCCSKCNSSRGTRNWMDFAHDVGRYVAADGHKIIAHISDCIGRPLNTKEAKAIIDRRGGWTATMTGYQK
jgi:hypothetical protein